MKIGNMEFDIPRSVVLGSTILVLLSGGAFLFGAVGDPQRIWANWLGVSFYLLGLGLGGAVLLAMFSVTGARWSTRIQPVAEKLTTLLPFGAAGMAIVLIFRPSLYPWIHANEDGSAFQTLWFNRPFFLVRSFVYLASWLGMTFLLVRASRRGKMATGVSAAFLVVFSCTLWLACTDWIMSLEPKWSSTIFGVYHFSGLFVSSLAALIVLSIWFERRGDFQGQLNRSQLHDLGTLLFAFSSFWMYIWFSQYLLIWYANSPEETAYFVRRQFDSWRPFFFANLVLNWGIPFVVLLFRSAKENRLVLLTVAITVLLGRWLDLYLMILPPIAEQQTAFGIWDVALLPGMVGLAALVIAMPSRAASQPVAV